MTAPAPLPMALIYPTLEGRPVVASTVTSLVESMKVIGLRTPITVRPSVQYADGREIEAFQIVAGRHRYEAARKLGWTEIEAILMDGDAGDAELWEIDENFARAELTDAQRADHHARRERILVEKGVIHAGQGRPKKGTKLASYSEQAAASLGLSETQVKRELRRGKNIAPEVLADVAGTDMDKGVVLDELAKLPKAEQAARVVAMRAEKDAGAKINRAATKAAALDDAAEAAEIIHGNLDLDQVDTLTARLASVSMKDFLAALMIRRAA
jgi:hypothetical protein